MADLSNKVIATNYQKLLNIDSTTAAITDGTGSAVSLFISGAAASTVGAGGHITASGNISASGDVIAGKFRWGSVTGYTSVPNLINNKMYNATSTGLEGTYYALQQDDDGNTTLNCKSGEAVRFAVATSAKGLIGSNGNFELGGSNISSLAFQPPEVLTVAGNISSSGATFYEKNTFSNDDATPSVANGTYWETGTNTDTITTFDGGKVGQIIYVISKAAITYDVTGTTLKGGDTDIVTAANDLTSWLYDGSNWILISFTDQSDDLS
tara:strand:+ start:2438 stop:3238 length:801 start_codon:yes stop_codon:yes gene_type:complete